VTSGKKKSVGSATARLKIQEKKSEIFYKPVSFTGMPYKKVEQRDNHILR
jgi:hypothetical protein